MAFLKVSFTLAYILSNAFTVSLQATPCSDLHTDFFLETSPVKDQCATGTCWAHPVTSSLEQHVRQDRGVEISLSEEFFYLRHLTVQAKELAEWLWAKGSLPKDDQGTESFFIEGQHVSKAYELGAVPDSVLTSKIITSSRNWFWNRRKNIYREYARIFKEMDQYIRKNANYFEHEEVRLKFGRRLDAVEVAFQERIKKKWRLDPDGESRFEFDGKWYSPKEYLVNYIYRGRAPAVKEISRDNHSWESLQSVVKTTLEKGETMTVTLQWNDEPAYQWFHDSFGIKVGAHAVELVGVSFYPDSKTIMTIRVKNSWGEAWGQKGFIDIPYEIFKVGFSRITYLANGVWQIEYIANKTKRSILD